MVLPPSDYKSPVSAQSNGHGRIFVIDGILDLLLNVEDQSSFDLRFAACECLKSYFSNHSDVRLHFLCRAIEGFQEGRDESVNVLTALLRPSTGRSASDPYRDWFAAVVTFHLLFDNPIAKTKALELTEGDSSMGEEVVTSVQAITAHLLSGIRRHDDARRLVGYLMLLLGWLFEDLDTVNDFLTEGSNVQNLIQAVAQPVFAEGELIQGLCAFLLGLVYEFSTSDSPIPRSTLHSVITSQLGRESYQDRLGKLRVHPSVRDFEITPQKLAASSNSELAEVFFDNIFVDFLKDNYSRMARAFDRDPGMEISVVTNGIQRGISRELVDSLRSQIEEKNQLIHDAAVVHESLEKLLHQQQAEHKHTREEASTELAKMRSDYADMNSSHRANIE